MRFWRSDDHFFHNNVNRLCDRPFQTMEEGHEELIRRHNLKVGPEDEVIFLGDFCWKHQHVKEILERMNGAKKVLYSGNHDQSSPAQGKADKFVPRYLEYGFDEVKTSGTVTVGGRLFQVCHYPYWDPNAVEYEQRYKEWRPVKGAEIGLLHGHSHSKRENRTKWHGAKLMLDLGVDGNDYFPYSEEELTELIEDSLNARASS